MIKAEETIQAVEDSCANPDIAEAKIGDLAGIRVYKFRFQRQDYRPSPVEPPRPILEVEFLMIDFYQAQFVQRFREQI